MFSCVIKSLLFIFLISNSFSEGALKKPPKQYWDFKGITGTFKKDALQRGFHVYKQKCATCHGMELLYFRNLKALGFNNAEIKAIASETTIMDGPNDDGEMFEREGEPKDKLISPYANEQAARSANNGALPPDLSAIVKGKLGGSDYIYALLTGYREPPEGFNLSEGMNYNTYVDGNQIAMAAPLIDNMIEYADGTPATISQMAKDVTTFLSWASEIESDERKQIGIQVMIFLIFMTFLFFLANRKSWGDIKKKPN